MRQILARDLTHSMLQGMSEQKKNLIMQTAPLIEHWLQNKVREWQHPQIPQLNQYSYFSEPQFTSQNMFRFSSLLSFFFWFHVKQIGRSPCTAYSHGATLPEQSIGPPEMCSRAPTIHGIPYLTAFAKDVHMHCLLLAFVNLGQKRSEECRGQICLAVDGVVELLVALLLKLLEHCLKIKIAVQCFYCGDGCLVILAILSLRKTQREVREEPVS
jgi:hypothetical protein